MQDQGSEFTPEELDRLEDALSSLGEPDGAPELAALPPRLRERLGEYEAVLAMAREALPMEDVEPGLLAGILAEARQAAPAAAKPAERGPSLWERLRRSFMLPGMALAGTAALLLWVARPDGEALPRATEAAPSPAATEAKRSEAPSVVSPAPKDMAPEAAPAEAVEVEKVSAAADELPVQPAAALPAPDARRDLAGQAKSKPGGYAPMKKRAEEALPLPGLDVQEETRIDVDKESVRDQLDRAEAARHKGRCAQAEADYAAVARSNGPVRERAKALVGLGLCRETKGDTAAADRYFAEARALDPVVAASAGQRERSAEKAKKATADGL